MTIDRSFIRVKAMVIAPNEAGDAHLVSVNPPTQENPHGYHRFIGGSVELGETHREAVLREVEEELGARLLDPECLGSIENIFRIDGVLGHEIVFLYTGRLDPMPAAEGATMTEIDGSVMPLAWRPFGADDDVPLYPAAAAPFVEQARAGGAARGA